MLVDTWPAPWIALVIVPANPKFLHSRGRSSDWLERRPVKPEVAGSSPVDPAMIQSS